MSWYWTLVIALAVFDAWGIYACIQDQRRYVAYLRRENEREARGE